MLGEKQSEHPIVERRKENRNRSQKQGFSEKDELWDVNMRKRFYPDVPL